MSRKTVLVTDRGNWDEFDKLESVIEENGGILQFGKCETLDEVISGCKDADILMTSKAPITREVIEAISPVENIIRMGVGCDTVNLGAASKHGIPVSNVPGHHVADALGEHAVGLMLAAAREMVYCDLRLREGDNWGGVEKGRSVKMMSDGTFGVIGLGHIGRGAAERAKGLSMKVIAYDPYLPPDVFDKLEVESVEFEDLLRRSDCVSIHTPLTAETYQMFSKDQFKQMKDDAVFVNTARGPIVDEEALVTAVENEEIFAAGIDNFKTEPPNESPSLSNDRIICSPHHGSAASTTKKRKTKLLREELERALTGKHLRHVVNTEVFRDNDNLINPEIESWT